MNKYNRCEPVCYTSVVVLSLACMHQQPTCPPYDGVERVNAPDSRLDQIVRDWLDEIPRQPLGKPPRDDLSDLESRWIQRGKRISSAEDALIKILRDKSSPYRRRAALVIGRIGSAKALDALAELFETDDVGLQRDAVASIRAIDSPKRVDVLAIALDSTYRQSEIPDVGIPSKKAIVRANIAIALSEIDEKGAEKLLTSLISVEKDPYVLSALKKASEKNR
jgi:HEAT repeat protein